MIKSSQRGIVEFSPNNWILLLDVPINVKQDLNSIFKTTLENKENTISINSHTEYQIQEQYRIQFPDSFFTFLSEALLEWEDRIKSKYVTDIEYLDFTNYGLGQFGTLSDWSEKFGGMALQKKYEYIPPHIRHAHLSFTYWHKVPYSFVEETAACPSPNASAKKIGIYPIGADSFYFNTEKNNSYWSKSIPNVAIGLDKGDIPSSKLYEGVIGIRPSHLMHSASAFYSTDEVKVFFFGDIIFKKTTTII